MLRNPPLRQAPNRSPVTNGLLVISDLLGKQIYSILINNNYQAQLELDITPGTFYLSIKATTGQPTVKLVIE